MKKGIDISYHQGDVIFEEVKKSGVEFVILRSSYRTSTDKKFTDYVTGCKIAKLPIKGIYHFSYALNKEQAVDEAKLSVSLAKSVGLKPKDIIIFYDFEYDTVKKAAQKGVSLTKKECNEFTLAFCEEIERLGYKAGIYTNLDYYKNWYEKRVLSSFRVWLADYTDGPDFSCLVQQYSSTGSVPGIKGSVDLDYWYEETKNEKEDFKIKEDLGNMRKKAVYLFCSWVGKNEKDGSYKEIIDIYNSKKPYPRGARMQYYYPWCACTWSAVAIKLGLTQIMPIEISCGELIKKAKEMGIWVEDDSYVAQPGDGILYDWDDDGKGDNTGWPDHIGMIVSADKRSKKFKVVEGNKNDAVDYRIISFNGKNIRGFITPKYEEFEKIIGNVNNPEKSDGKKATVTATSLRVRESAPSGNTIGYLSKGKEVSLTGDTKKFSEENVWYEIFYNSGKGWCSGKYLNLI